MEARKLNYLAFLSKEPFKYNFRMYFFMLLSNSISASLYLSVIWLLSESFGSLLEVLKLESEKIISLSIFLNIIFFTFLLLLNFNMLKFYILLPPWKSSKRSDSKLTHDGKFRLGYAPVLFASVVVIMILLYGYYVDGEAWREALYRGLVVAFPILIAFATVGLVGMIIFLVLGTVGYIVQSNRN